MIKDESLEVLKESAALASYFCGPIVPHGMRANHYFFGIAMDLGFQRFHLFQTAVDPSREIPFTISWENLTTRRAWN